MEGAISARRLNPLPPGSEPLPAGSITDCVILRRDGVSAVSLRNGDVDQIANESTGVYWRDTRFCSEIKLTIAGAPPVLLDQVEAGPLHTAAFTNPPLRDPAGRAVGERSFLIRRRRLVLDALHESFLVSNYSLQRESLDVCIEFATDFADIFEVRGLSADGPRGAIDTQIGDDAVVVTYSGRDGTTRASHFRFAPAPNRLSATSALFSLEIEPGASVEIQMTVAPVQGIDTDSFETRVMSARLREASWLDSLTSIETDNDILNECVRRSLLDIDALRTRVDGEEFIAAGVPWFDTLFGRDSLITGMLMAPFTPGPLRAALSILAAHQADSTIPARDSEPGKIPHELRWGELSRAGVVPFGQYYGSVDATPLFLMAAADYARWFGDDGLVRSIGRSLLAALAWCERAAGDGGILSYHRTSAAGLENQGWKDSLDAVVWSDGRAVEPPIALIEVQAYRAAAGAGCVEMASFLDGDIRARGAALRDRALEALERRFSDADLGYVLCLDGAGKGVPTPTSNAGHVLWAGAATSTAAARVADRLFGDDLYSGWGIRTLGATVTSFNPLGYHTGSIWPHDNAIIALGLRRYGMDRHALRLVDALLDAALAFSSYRLPELFCGDSRDLQLVPTPYPVASRPQSWSSAAVPSLLMTAVGIRALSPAELSVTRPLLPRGVNWLKIRNLRFGDSSADLQFQRDGDAVHVEVEAMRGSGRLVLQTAPPST